MGPYASVLVPRRLDVDARAEVRTYLKSVGVQFGDDGFKVDGRPIYFSFKSESDSEIVVRPGVSEAIGWTPEDDLHLFCGFKDEQDHRLLGKLCVRFAKSLDGIIELCGALPIKRRGEARCLWDESADWSEWEPHLERMIRGLPGTLYDATPGDWPYHLCDWQFLEAWLQHPDFRMVK